MGHEDWFIKPDADHGYPPVQNTDVYGDIARCPQDGSLTLGNQNQMRSHLNKGSSNNFNAGRGPNPAKACLAARTAMKNADTAVKACSDYGDACDFEGSTWMETALNNQAAAMKDWLDCMEPFRAA